jgi:uncharacterized protein YcfJ
MVGIIGKAPGNCMTPSRFKGAIIGGLAGHMAGHGKVGAIAGCVIGRHEANKADAEKANSTGPNPQPKDEGKL